jgi:thiamine-monophosphate kinase
MPEKGENALIAWLRQRFPADPVRVAVGIGDDMAVVKFDSAHIAITADMLLDGVHFDIREHSYELIGRKAIACSLSDCAAMGCEPVAATISVALPETMTLEAVKRLYEGMAAIADEHGCRIVGGDTTSWPGRLAIDVAMLAEPMAPRGPIRRSDARPGDTIYVSGPLGGSILGSHLTFTPRLELARQLVRQPGLHAMMDLSDGLSMDLDRLCEASKYEAELYADQLENTISDAARELAGREPARLPATWPGGTALEHALNDGEDFELLVIGGEDLGGLPLGLIPVGRIVPYADTANGVAAAPSGGGAGAGRSRITLVHADGRREVVEPCGYEHFKP